MADVTETSTSNFDLETYLSLFAYNGPSSPAILGHELVTVRGSLA